MMRLRRFIADTRGAAAAEFVLWILLLTLPVFNAVDIATYAYQRMQLELAAQAGAQAAWHACDTAAKLPATQNCSGLSTKITNAVSSTSLGVNAAVPAGGVAEGYYCTNSAGALVAVGTAGTFGSPPVKPTPFTCASVIGGSTTAPADYVRVTVSYTYAPIFPSVSVASLLQTPITKTAWMRMN